jgi:hypothetical protein
VTPHLPSKRTNGRWQFIANNASLYAAFKFGLELSPTGFRLERDSFAAHNLIEAFGAGKFEL